MKRLRSTICALGFTAITVIGAVIAPTAAQAHPHYWDEYTYWGAYSSPETCYDLGKTYVHRYNWHAYFCEWDRNDGRLVYELWYIEQK